MTLGSMGLRRVAFGECDADDAEGDGERRG
jgi:hypothetical protein